ncbi:MAG: hypothetical protein GC185_05695 [Alphaproteobacteria bacterium]|nr:hypothetical protein [Alphaproteobacteria bacterium]
MLKKQVFTAALCWMMITAAPLAFAQSYPGLLPPAEKDSGVQVGENPVYVTGQDDGGDGNGANANAATDDQAPDNSVQAEAGIGPTDDGSDFQDMYGLSDSDGTSLGDFVQSQGDDADNPGARRQAEVMKKYNERMRAMREADIAKRKREAATMQHLAKEATRRNNPNADDGPYSQDGGDDGYYGPLSGDDGDQGGDQGGE